MKTHLLLIIAALAVILANAALAQTWTQTSAPITNWTAVASSADGTKLVAGVYNGQIYTSIPSSVSSTTTGTAGYLTGGQNTAIELQYLGNGQFLPISHEGIIPAF